MMAPHRILLLLLAGAALAVVLPAWSAGGDVERLREQVLTAREELWKNRAAERALTQFEQTLPSGSASDVPAKEAIPGLEATLARLVRESSTYDDLKKLLDQPANVLLALPADREEKALRALRDIEKNHLEMAGAAFDAEARLRQDRVRVEPGLVLRVAADPHETGMSRVLRLVIWSWLVLTASLLLTAVAVRLFLRRRYRILGRPSRRATVLTLVTLLAAWLVVPVGAGFVLRSEGRPLLAIGNEATFRYKATLRAELARCADENAQLRSRIERYEQQIASRTRNLGSAGLPDELARDIGAKLGMFWENVRRQALGNYRVAALHAAIVELEQQRSELSRQLNTLSNTPVESTNSSVQVVSILLGLCLAVPVLVACIAPLTRRAGSCPRCLATDAPVRQSGAATNPAEMRWHCLRCQYQWPVKHRHRPRLSFATLGAKSSGKSFWLLYAAARLACAAPPGWTRYPRLDAEGRAFEDAIQVAYVGTPVTAPTPSDRYLPIPEVWECSDPALASVLLYLFDYSGDLLSGPAGNRTRRQQPVGMNGLLFFLDPTQSGNAQLARLGEWCSGQRHLTSIPIAICVSHLDRLIDQTPFGTAALDWLRRLDEVDSTYPALSERIEARSRLVEEVLCLLFPECTGSLLRTLRGHFGDNFRFFPVLPRPADFSVLNPVFWLLYRHGYRVGNGGEQ